MTMQFWFSKDADKLRLPINPETLTVNSPYGTQTIQIDGLGDVDFLTDRGVKEINFESFFPLLYNPSYCLYSGFPSPQECIDLIEKWRATKEPIRLAITESGINLLVTIPDFNCVDKAGNNGDKFFSITCKEYKEFKIKQITVTTTSTKPSSRPSPPPKKSQTYTVKKGDCLWAIAKRFYSSGAKWKTIYNANKSVIGKNPNLIYPGQRLVIP